MEQPARPVSLAKLSICWGSLLAVTRTATRYKSTSADIEEAEPDETWDLQLPVVRGKTLVGYSKEKQDEPPILLRSQ
jgi:hypothetical protein